LRLKTNGTRLHAPPLGRGERRECLWNREDLPLSHKNCALEDQDILSCERKQYNLKL
jgi:hypothetical protein